MSGTPNSSDGGTYTVCIDASNGVEPDATQAFTLVVTSPAVPYQAQVSAPSGDPVSANIALDSGVKSFQGFEAAQSKLGSSTTVTFSTVGTSTFTAAVNVDFGDLPYCLPYAVVGTPGLSAHAGDDRSARDHVHKCAPLLSEQHAEPHLIWLVLRERLLQLPHDRRGSVHQHLPDAVRCR